MSHFEVFILNYNGQHFLENCLSALERVHISSHAFVINVVDNGSSDDSKKFVLENFPKVNFIALDENLGFSNGNNAGVKIRNEQLAKQGKRADFYVFLNNDTAVDTEWLLQAAEQFEKDSTVGIVGSKSVFFDDFIILNIQTEPSFSPKNYGSPDTRDLGVRLHEPIACENILEESSRKKYLGAYAIEGDRRWLSPNAVIYLPVKKSGVESELLFSIDNLHPGELAQRVTIRLNEQSEPSTVISIDPQSTVQVKLPSTKSVSVIQNAGSFVNKNWEGGDVGFLQVDRGQYDEEREVAAVCGVSLFIRSKLYNQLGGFEPHTFAYYEDTDLSLRARLRGWRCVYAPKSLLKHVHCGSGVENSHYFTKNVVYSRLHLASKMMSRAAWFSLLKTYQSNAQREYDTEHSLDAKPFSNALKNYKRNRSGFLKNRLFAMLKNPSKQLAEILYD